MYSRDEWVPQTAKRFAKRLARHKQSRMLEIQSNRKTRPPRSQLTKKQRAEILRKTDSRCHICGGKITGDKWQADHVLSYSKGGKHSVDNYLAAHSTCNNYRWHYSSEEFQEIMRLGVWIRTRIINQTKLGMEVATEFVKHERNRIKRRVTKV